MQLAVLLIPMDGNENITIIESNSRKKLYEGLKRNVYGVDFGALVTAIYTVSGFIVIEAC